MASDVRFPKDTASAERVYSELLNKGRRLRRPVELKWWVSYWYSKGARQFNNVDYTKGTLQVNYMDEDGVLGFQYEEILSKYQAQLGRLLSLNLSPVANKKGISLEGMRKAGIAQTALDAALPDDKIDKLSLALWPTLLLYGTAGLGVWMENTDSFGIEVIPPWELFPIPLNPATDSDLKGIMRIRHVPAEWIDSLEISKGKKKGQVGDNKYPELSMTKGDMPNPADNMFSATTGTIDAQGHEINSAPYPGGQMSKKEDKVKDNIQEFGEVWLETPDGYLSEYLIFRNGKLIHRSDHSLYKFHRPVRIAHDIKVGGFWARSFFETLIPLNTEAEYVIGKVFQDMQDFDLYGVLMEPTTSGTPVEATTGGDGIRRIRYEPDYTAPEIKPFNMYPKMAGMLPVKIAEFATLLIDRVANQPRELMGGDAPGRVDSSSGLGLLMETSAIPLAPVAKSVADALSGCYKALLGLLRRYWEDDKLIDVSRLDDNLMGISFDPATGKMKLADNGIPHPDEITIRVASQVPKSKEKDIMELKEALQTGIITPFEYAVEVYEKGLDIPAGHKVEWENYRRAKYENLILFGDGQKPGEIIYSEDDKHPIHLKVLDVLRAKPEFYQASDEVRAKCAEHYAQHLAGMGKLPDEMAYPEEAASMAMGIPPEGAGMPPMDMMQG